GPLIENHRKVRKCLDVVDDGRLAEQPLDRREWRPWTRHPSFPFNRMDQRSLLAAYKCAGTHLQLDGEINSAVEDVVAEKATRLGLLKCLGEAFDGQRILCPDIYVGFGGSDCIAGYQHAFNQPVR